jgi:hypothetical protein
MRRLPYGYPLPPCLKLHVHQGTDGLPWPVGAPPDVEIVFRLAVCPLCEQSPAVV